MIRRRTAVVASGKERSSKLEPDARRFSSFNPDDLTQHHEMSEVPNTRSIYRHFLRVLGRLSAGNGGRKANLRRLYGPQLKPLLMAEDANLANIQQQGMYQLNRLKRRPLMRQLCYSQPNSSIAFDVAQTNEEPRFAFVSLLSASSPAHEQCQTTRRLAGTH